MIVDNFEGTGNCYATISCGGTSTIITCVESSSPYGIVDVTIPEETKCLSFDYKFTSLGDVDYASITIDKTPVWVMNASSVAENEWGSSGLIPISELGGNRKLKVQLHGEGQPNIEVSFRNFTIFSVVPVEEVLNIAPIAVAGDSANVDLGVLVTLDGISSYDPDSGPEALIYDWGQESGPVVLLDDAYGSSPSFIPEEYGDYVFSLLVFDGEAWSEPDSVTITVEEIPLPGDLNGDGVVDLVDISKINSYRNQSADACPDCDIDGDNTITVLDARMLIMMCTYPRCASNM